MTQRFGACFGRVIGATDQQPHGEADGQTGALAAQLTEAARHSCSPTRSTRQTDRHTGRRTDRQTDRHTHTGGRTDTWRDV
jgi:hypothetical protein